MSILHPSPALMVRADTSVSECVRHMRDHEVGSILIMNDIGQGPAELIGIFTERDLLEHIDEIQHGGFWDRPIRTVMSHPVVMLDITDLEKAGETMLECGFRHLPIAQQDKSGRQELIGMVSMRDLFRQAVEERKGRPKKSSLTIGILSDDSNDAQTYTRGLLSSLQGRLQRVSVAELRARGPNFDALLIDLDRQEARTWPKILRDINHSDDLPLTVVLYDPFSHPPQTVVTLQKLKEAEKFAVFAKPVNLIALMRRLRS